MSSAPRESIAGLDRTPESRIVEPPPSTDARWIRCPSSPRRVREEDESPAVGEERRPNVHLLDGDLDRRDGARLGSAAGVESIDRPRLRSEDDHIVASPGAAVGLERGAADASRRAAVECCAPDLAAHEVAELAAVGRPERPAALHFARAGDRARLRRAERPDPDLGGAVLGPDTERQMQAIRRQRERAGLDPGAGNRDVERERRQLRRSATAEHKPGSPRTGRQREQRDHRRHDDQGRPDRSCRDWFGALRRIGRRRQHDPRFAGIAEPLLRIALEAAAQQFAHARRRRGRQGRQVGFARHHEAQRFDDGIGGEERPSGQHLVEHDAERPDVRAAVDRLPLRLFRRHVGGGAQDRAELGAGSVDRGQVSGAGERRGERRPAAGIDAGGRLAKRFGEAEVQHLGRTVGPHLDVGRLEVAMDDALLVGRLERFRDLAGERQCFVERHRSAREMFRERLALDEFHHQRPDGGGSARTGRLPVSPAERGQCGGLFEPVDLCDVRMIERREHPGFALEPHEAIGVGSERLRQDLQRDLAVEPRIPRAIDLPHPACPERAEDLIRAEPSTSGEAHDVPSRVESTGVRIIRRGTLVPADDPSAPSHTILSAVGLAAHRRDGFCGVRPGSDSAQRTGAYPSRVFPRAACSRIVERPLEAADVEVPDVAHGGYRTTRHRGARPQLAQVAPVTRHHPHPRRQRIRPATTRKETCEPLDDHLGYVPRTDGASRP
jgi:hypothetical protein